MIEWFKRFRQRPDYETWLLALGIGLFAVALGLVAITAAEGSEGMGEASGHHWVCRPTGGQTCTTYKIGTGLYDTTCSPNQQCQCE